MNFSGEIIIIIKESVDDSVSFSAGRQHNKQSFCIINIVQAKLQTKTHLIHIIAFTSHLRICSIILCRILDEIDWIERNCSNRRAIQRRSISL